MPWEASPAESVIDEHAYEWGMAVAQHSVLTIESEMKGNVFETDHAKLVERAARRLAKAGGTLTMRDFYKSMHLNKRDADLLIESMQASGEAKKVRAINAINNKADSFYITNII